MGFFLRAYNFSPWLHFELDQARDARVVDAALSGGPGELTLLGPKAGGTFLRLAPGFYYLEYISALVFGGTPQGMATFVMVFSVLAIPLFYFLVRRYFSIYFSLGVTLLFAVSHYFVMYGRFAWNPNLIPFFMILGAYALLRSVDHGEERPGKWFLLAMLSFTLATHFHFLVFLSVPAIVGTFLLLKRPRFSWRVWAGTVAIVALLYLPMVLNEIETGGLNTKEFFGAITEKSTKEDHVFLEKVLRNTSEHTLNALVVTTGFEGGTSPAFTTVGGLKWICQGKCDDGKWYGVTSFLILALGILALVFFYFKEIERKKKDFLLLIVIWFIVTFVLFLPLAYGMAPRFFLLSGPLFFIFLGLTLRAFKKIFHNSKIAKTTVVLTFLLLAFSNVYFLSHRFDELSRAETESIKNAPDRILKERIRVTLQQQNHIVDLFERRSKETGFPVYMFSEPQHRRALKYLMEKRGIQNAVLGFDGVYRQGVYYLVFRSQSNLEDALKKYRVGYNVGERTSFGTLVVIELTPKTETIIADRQDFSVPKPSDSKAPPRYTWKEFFDRNSVAPSIDQEDGSLDQLEETAKDN